MNRVSAATLVLLAASCAAGQVSPQVIFTKIPGHPTSVVPGAKDLDGNPAVSDFRALEDFVVDPNNANSWVLKARTQLGTDLETCLIASRTGTPFMLAQEGQFAPGSDPSHRYEFFASAMGRYNDSGVHVFGFRTRPNRSGTAQTLTDGHRIAVWDGTTIDVRIKQGDSITGLVDTTTQGDERFGNSVGSMHILNDGSIGTQDSTITNISSTRRPALMYDNAGFQQSNVSSVTALDGSASTWATMLGNSFYTSTDGQHWIALGRRVGQATADDMLAYNNTAVIESGQPIGSSSVIAADIFNANVLADGTWLARGDDAADNDWFARNGQVLAKTGDPITTGSTELWGNSFLSFAANTAGDWLLIGNTDNPVTSFDSVIVLNGETVLLREGDPIDLDGNGQFDDNVFIGRSNTANAAFIADTLNLTEDGTAYVIVNLVDADGIEYNSSPSFGTPNALIKFSINQGSTCSTCTGDYNQDGGVTGDDVEGFFTDWEISAPCADVNQDGGVDGTDVEFFFVAWEQSSC